MQTLKEKTRKLKTRIKRAVRLVEKPMSEDGKDGTVDCPPQKTNSLNWNKGWGKYGKT